MSNNDNHSRHADKLIKQLVQTAPMPELPANFADSVSRSIAAQHQAARLESRLATFFLLVTIIAVLAATLGTMGVIVRALMPLQHAPWPLLLATAAILLAVKLYDMLRQKADSPAQLN